MSDKNYSSADDDALVEAAKQGELGAFEAVPGTPTATGCAPEDCSVRCMDRVTVWLTSRRIKDSVILNQKIGCKWVHCVS